MFTVLVQRGKAEEATLVSVKHFQTKAQAEDYCAFVNTYSKYWVFAQVVEDDEFCRILKPFEKIL